MIGYRNLLISLFCSMAVSAAGQSLSKTLCLICHRKLPITFARGIYKAMWPAIKSTRTDQGCYD